VARTDCTYSISSIPLNVTQDSLLPVKQSSFILISKVTERSARKVTEGIEGRRLVALTDDEDVHD
jgi:hypothetical protein